MSILVRGCRQVLSCDSSIDSRKYETKKIMRPAAQISPLLPRLFILLCGLMVMHLRHGRPCTFNLVSKRDARYEHLPSPSIHPVRGTNPAPHVIGACTERDSDACRGNCSTIQIPRCSRSSPALLLRCLEAQCLPCSDHSNSAPQTAVLRNTHCTVVPVNPINPSLSAGRLAKMLGGCDR
jgi:hypothetical protein